MKAVLLSLSMSWNLKIHMFCEVAMIGYAVGTCLLHYYSKKKKKLLKSPVKKLHVFTLYRESIHFTLILTGHEKINSFLCMKGV